MIKTTVLFIAARFLPNFTLNIKAIKEILLFGINLAGERIVNFFAQRADYLLIGKYLGSAALGFYSMATEISTLPQNKFSSIIARVTYPAYSIIQEDNARLGRAYLKVISLVSSITFPILFLIVPISKKFIVLFLGDKWLPAVPILQLLCLLGSLKSVGYLVGSLLNAKGRSDIGFKWSFVMLAGTLVGVTIGMHWGLMGAALGYCISFVILLPIIQTIALRLIGLRLTAYIKALLPALTSAFLMSVALWYFGAGIIKGSTAEKYVSFFLALFLGASMYLVGIYILNKKNIEELWQMGKMIFREVK
jgi:PST family polysaccharide transporter